MLRRRTRKLVSKYVAHYGPDRYGPRGWPAEAKDLNVRGVHARMRELLDDVRNGHALDWTTSALTLREAAAVLDFNVADSLKTMKQIDAKYGEVFITAAYVSGEAGAAYHRLLTVRGHLEDARWLGTSLRFLAARYDRRAALRRLLASISARNS